MTTSVDGGLPRAATRRSGGAPVRTAAPAAASSRRRRSLLALLFALPALWHAPLGQAQPVRSPIVALPQYAAAGTDELYYLDLGNGVVTWADQLRRNPLTTRTRRLDQNLFREIGRPVDQPAAVGEVLLGPISTSGASVRAALLVESSTGYVAFFDELGKNRTFGRFSSAIGRPFAPLASTDGNYALLMSHDGNGRSEGAYLYHAGGGRGLYLGGLAKLRTDVDAVTVSGFPRLTGHLAAAELRSSERTVGYLVADVADGALRFLDLETARRITVRDSPVGLFPTFAAETEYPLPERFVAAPILSRGGTTTHVLLVDAASGDLAVLAGLEEGARTPTLAKIAANVYGALATAAGAGSRTLAAVPNRTASGATAGVWLIDSLTRRLAYVEGAETPASATVRRVRDEG